MTIATGQIILAADVLKHATQDGYLEMNASTELTIASDAVTITQNFHRIDTEANAAWDYLTTITLGSNMGDGFVLVLVPENTNRTVVLRDSAGNIKCPGASDVVMDETHQMVVLIYSSALSKWVVVNDSWFAKMFRRQGGASSVFSSGGTTDYEPFNFRIQFGAANVSCVSGQSNAQLTVTFPHEFGGGCWAIASLQDTNFSSNKCFVTVGSNAGGPPTTTMVLTVYPSGATFANSFTALVYWIAIGLHSNP